MVSAQTSSAIEALLNGPKREKLIEDMARAILHRHDALDYSHRLLEQFTIGFTA
ncbi:MAG: hypothetical protein IPM01_26235 [Burkholderiaceae bacterium]|nr:hypothetical protein [Burkholderiaceae bacterium]